jgi:hypothetical protein
MIKKAATLLATGIFSAAVAVAFLDPAAAEEQNQRQRMISLTESQTMLAQKMGKELLLVALGIDKKGNLDNLEASRALFERTLRALREGDGELGLLGSRNPDFLEGLSKVGELWLLYDATIRRSTTSNAITADQVGTVDDLSRPISDAVKEAVEVLHEEARQANLISMLDTTIHLAAHQVALTQQMSKEFLLIVYGHETAKNRKSLSDSMALFDQTLEGLINGDPELRLLPAPNPDIKAQLRTAGRIWDDFRPLLSAAVRGGGVDRSSIDQVARINLSLLEAFNATISMYEAL